MMLDKQIDRTLITGNGYRLYEYDHHFDAGLATMWNESDDQWPGTFTRGVPFDEERVAEWMDRVEAIVKFIAVREKDSKVVGYGDLWEDRARPGSCYVALLNVHPHHQGKSLARKMLVSMVDWATENGYDRLTIGTWPANLKAMPLYKKVGFFWEPDTNVHMENYVPAVRQLPVARKFFARNDWYWTYVRELAQVEDDIRHPHTGDMKVYMLRWEAEDELIEAVFDRNAQDLTGIETTDFAAYTRVSESEPAQGVLYSICWELINKKDCPIKVSIHGTADDGIDLNYRTTVSLPPGHREVLETKFRCRLDAPRFDRENHDIPTPKIISNLTIDQQKVVFGTGLRYRPAVEFNLIQEDTTLLPGQRKTVHLQLHNRVNRPISGRVHITPQPGLNTDWQTYPFSAGADGYTGLPLTVVAERNGFFHLVVYVTFPDGDEEVTTEPKHLPLVAIHPGHWAAGEGDEELILENDFFRVTCKARSGVAKIWNKVNQREEVKLLEEIGPPFVPWDLFERVYELALDQDDGVARAVMTVHSGRFPGLIVGREIGLTASPILKVRNWVANNSDEIYDLQVRPVIRNRRFEERYLVVPLKEGIVREHGSVFGNVHGDFPEEPDSYGEEWVAYERAGQVSGVIWPAGAVEKIQSDWGDLFFYLPINSLSPGATIVAPPLYLYQGPGDWHAVRQAWERARGERVTKIAEGPPPRAQRCYQVNLDPSPLVTVGGSITSTLRVTNTRDAKLEGKLNLELPQGWKADRSGFEISELTNKAPFKKPVTLQFADASVGAWEGKWKLETQSHDNEQSFHFIRLGDGELPVQVKETAKNYHAVWQITNGQWEWEIAPDFNAAVIGWREMGRETNHLFSSFPESGELSWIKPWYGGIRPTLHNWVADQGWPGKLHEETFVAMSIENMDGRGLNWQGVRLASGLRREAFRGLRAEIEYLTLGGSNVLKVVYRLVNLTSVYRSVEPGLMAFLQVDGDHKNGVLHCEDFHRKRTPTMAWSVVGEWAAISNPDTGRAITMINASGWQRVQMLDWGEDGGHLHCFEATRVPPEEVYEMVIYMVLAESVAEARRYCVLSKLL